MRINRILGSSFSNGPGERLVIWFQGCSIKCNDCINKDTWDISEGYNISLNDLHSLITNQKLNITLTGGEPLDQFENVLELCKLVFDSKSIFITTGYTLEIVKLKFSDILNYCDILVSGPFIKNEYSNSSLWRGSKNQQLTFLTDRGNLEFQNDKKKIKSEIIIDKKTNTILTTGFSINKNFL